MMTTMVSPMTCLIMLSSMMTVVSPMTLLRMLSAMFGMHAPLFSPFLRLFGLVRLLDCGAISAVSVMPSMMTMMAVWFGAFFALALVVPLSGAFSGVLGVRFVVGRCTGFLDTVIFLVLPGLPFALVPVLVLIVPVSLCLGVFFFVIIARLPPGLTASTFLGTRPEEVCQAPGMVFLVYSVLDVLQPSHG